MRAVLRLQLRLRPAVDTLNDVDVCDSYTLPALNNGTYYSGTGGTGTQYPAGDIITSSQTMYIYARNDSATGSNYCENESSFEITITPTPAVDTLHDG